MKRLSIIAVLFFIVGCQGIPSDKYEWDDQTSRCRDAKSGQFVNSDLCSNTGVK